MLPCCFWPGADFFQTSYKWRNKSIPKKPLPVCAHSQTLSKRHEISSWLVTSARPACLVWNRTWSDRTKNLSAQNWNRLRTYQLDHGICFLLYNFPSLCRPHHLCAEVPVNSDMCRNKGWSPGALRRGDLDAICWDQPHRTVPGFQMGVLQDSTHQRWGTLCATPASDATLAVLETWLNVLSSEVPFLGLTPWQLRPYQRHEKPYPRQRPY